MTTTYRVTKGQQYDRDGASVEISNSRGGGVLYASYAADGSYDCGHLPAAQNRQAVTDVVKRVIASGAEETITTGEPAKMVAPRRERTGDINRDYGMDA
jgi:hypothetical protein